MSIGELSDHSISGQATPQSSISNYLHDAYIGCTKELATVSGSLSGLEKTGEKVLQASRDHVHNSSTMQLVGEGIGLTAVATALCLSRRAPQVVLGAAARSLTGTEEDLAELGASRLPFNLTSAGKDLNFKVTADGLARRVTVHLHPGFSPDKPTSVYYLLDGVQVNNPAGNMLGINGWARTADARNLVAVNIEQAKQSALRVFGVPLPGSLAGRSIPNITSWSFDHGLLNKTAGIDDVKAFTSVYSRMQDSMTVKANNIVAFSDGGPLANVLAAGMPKGSLNGVANVAGTIMKDAPMPKPGIKGFFVNSMHDPTIPLEGGPGPQLTKWLPKLGQRHILKSVPEQQGARFAESNGLLPTPKVTETPVYIQKDYVTAAGDGEKVRAFILKKGGHTWPGRDLGDGTSTAFTNANGATVSHEEFPTNDRIVDFLERGVPIKRTLE